MRGAWMAALLLAGGALAGDEASPEITDDANDAGAGAAAHDIVAGWFNDTATDIVGTLKLAQLPSLAPGAGYYLIVDLGGATYGWGVFGGPEGSPSYFVSHWDRQAGPQDFAQGSGEVRPGAPGSPGYITANLPKAFAGNATAGMALTTVVAGSGQLTPVAFVPAPLPLPGNAFFQQLDDASGSDYVLTSGSAGNASVLPVAGSPNATGPGSGNGTGHAPGPGEAPQRTPAPALALAAGGLAVAALVARRRR